MKIAVIGGGISGMGAAVILGGAHEVHLFEADSRLGGHAHTVSVQDPAGGAIPLDTGFLVYNELNYPQLTAFFRHLQVETALSDMSLSVKSEKTGLEWCGTSLNTVFGQRRNLVKPSFVRMLLDILRFHREAEANLVLARRHGWSLRDLLREGGFSSELAHDYLLPIGAATMIQGITIREDLFYSYRKGTDFIQQYVFPGGILLTDKTFREKGAENRMGLADRLEFPGSYVKTLKSWRENFAASRPSVEAMGFDEKFIRMWNLYLAYCEGAFRANRISVGQYLLER